MDPERDSQDGHRQDPTSKSCRCYACKRQADSEIIEYSRTVEYNHHEGGPEQLDMLTRAITGSLATAAIHSIMWGAANIEQKLMDKFIPS